VTVLDISLTGCLVRAEQRLDAGSIHELELQLEGQPLAARARVSEASVDGAAAEGAPRYLVGLEFLGLGAREEALLRGFLETARPRHDGT